MKTKMLKYEIIRTLISCVFLFFLCMIAMSVSADENTNPYVNVEEEYSGYAPAFANASVMTLPFDPNNYMFLIYDNSSDENSIRAAMAKIGIPTSRYTVCDTDNPVTLNLLTSHDILIVGWESGSDTTNKDGLITSVIEQGITGRVILSGHDSDYHTVNVEAEDAATTFFIQEIEYILNGSGTGLLVCADPQRNLDWLPESWGITANSTSGTDITAFTQDGLNSGVYDDLTLELMSDWSTTYHNTLTAWGDGFKSFELGENSAVVTIAAPINPRGFDLQKYDDVADGNCVNIDDPIEYTIKWHNMTDQTFYDAYIRDVFPAGVTYPVEYTFDPNTWEFISSDPFYQEEDHTYLYPIGTLSPDDSGVLQLGVIINALAEPGYYLHNVAELWATVYDPNGQNPVEFLIASAYENTLACCWDTNGILYVDQNATGSNTGVSWENAYTDLQDALTRAKETHCTFDYVIYCAQGIYAPLDENNGFVLSEGISLYGGFPTGGCDFADRNPKKYETILTGLIDEVSIADSVVSMGDETQLNGFTVNMGLTTAVSGDGVDFSIEHCIIKDNFQSGINAVNSNVTIQWCTINSNGTTGIYHTGTDCTFTVDNSWIMRNGEYGIHCIGSTPTIRNSIVSESDMTEQGRQGIRIENPTFPPKIYNATIANNKTAGIYFEDDTDALGDANNLDYPDLQNSIVYYNNNGGLQLTGFKADLHANFCCIQDCNELYTNNFNDEPGFAYTVDPNGVPDPNNYHLSANSVCIDQSNPFLSYTNQVDIDGEGIDRQYGTAVDVGADEVYDCYDDYLSEADVYNALDWNADGFVNLKEYAAFSAAWLTYDPNHPYCDPNNPYYVSDPNAPGYISELDKERFNSKCDLDSDLDVDLDDVLIFVEDTPWLWIACWKLEEINAAAMAMQSQAQSQSMMFESMVVESSQSITSSEAPAQEPSLESSAMTEEAIEEEQTVSAETLAEIIGVLDEILLTETDNIEGVMEIKALLQDELDAILAAQEQ